MKKSIVKNICTLIFLSLILSFQYLVTTASYAAVRIYNYSQKEYGSIATRSWGKSSNLATNGCSVFSIAHAIQWLDSNNVYSSASDSRRLLDLLLAVNNDPPANGASKYPEYVSKAFGFSKVNIKWNKNVARNWYECDEAWIKNHFDKGGVCLISYYKKDHGKHYALAVGYGIYNNQTYIHIVDSQACAATNRDIPIYKITDNVPLSIDKGLYGGDDYWMLLSRFHKSATADMIIGLLPATYSQAETLQFVDVKYPKIYKISNAGYSISGRIQTNGKLVRVTSEIKNKDTGKTVCSGNVFLATGNFNISALDNGKNNGQKFSMISSEGNYVWTLTAEDDIHEPLVLSLDFYATYDGVTEEDYRSLTYYGDIQEIIDDDAYYTLSGISLDASIQGNGFNAGSYTGSSQVETYRSPSNEADVHSMKDALGLFHVLQVYTMEDSSRWAKLEDGSFIQMDQLDFQYQYKNAAVKVGTYKAVIDTQWGRAPFDAKGAGVDIAVGDPVEVVSAVRNRYGKLWYGLESNDGGRWIYSEHLAFYDSPVNIKTTGLQIPAGNLPRGEKFTLEGKIVSDEKITTVEALILNQNTGKPVDAKVFKSEKNPVIISPNSNVIDIKQGKLNQFITIEDLPDGSYCFVIKAQTISAKNMITLAESSFTIGNASAQIHVTDPKSRLMRTQTTQPLPISS